MRALVIVLASLAGVARVQSHAAAPPKFPPGVDGSTRVTYYEVHGRTAAEVAADMRRKAPKRDDGQLRAAFTDSRLRWKFVTRPEGSLCRATDARVTISADVLMPRWLPPDDTEPGVLAMWNQSTNALAIHETGHREVLVRFAKTIRERILAMRVRCDRFNTEANAASNALVGEMRAAQAKYDADTQDGLTQGSAFPPRHAPDSLAIKRALMRP